VKGLARNFQNLPQHTCDKKFLPSLAMKEPPSGMLRISRECDGKLWIDSPLRDSAGAAFAAPGGEHSPPLHDGKAQIQNKQKRRFPLLCFFPPSPCLPLTPLGEKRILLHAHKELMKSMTAHIWSRLSKDSTSMTTETLDCRSYQ
jgi:hypothetical protein